MKRLRSSWFVAPVAAAALLLPLTTAGAAPVVNDPVATGLLGPLQLTVGPKGSVFVAQAFAGAITEFTTTGVVKPVAGIEGGVGGIDMQPLARGVAFTATTGPEEAPVTTLNTVDKKGVVRQVANLGAYEQRVNPDAGATYGFRSLPAECAAQWPTEQAGPVRYRGIVESNPYAVRTLADGSYLVADAAANAVLRVTPAGRISTFAVLPPQPTVVNQSMIDQFGFPECTLGRVYWFEPVPTDVEISRGAVYVSTLPGGPEDPSAGARGSIYRINLFTGARTRIADGLAGATNIAVSPIGRVYVTEFFAGRVSRIHDGRPIPVATLPGAVAAEFALGKLYVSTVDFEGPNGQVVTITP